MKKQQLEFVEIVMISVSHTYPCECVQRVQFDDKEYNLGLVTYIAKKENATFIIVLKLLNRMAFTLNFHFN